MNFNPFRNKPLFSAASLLLAAVVCAAVLLSAGKASAASVMLGDADGSGTVNINDVTCIQTKVAEFHVSEGFSQAAADIDGNGEVTIADATLLQRWLAEYESQYEIGVRPTEPATQMPTDENGWGRVIFKP